MDNNSIMTHFQLFYILYTFYTHNENVWWSLFDGNSMFPGSEIKDEHWFILKFSHLKQVFFSILSSSVVLILFKLISDLHCIKQNWEICCDMNFCHMIQHYLMRYVDWYINISPRKDPTDVFFLPKICLNNSNESALTFADKNLW